MRKDKNKAIELRKQNKSYNEIRQILGVSKSTLAAWFKNDPMSKKVKVILTKQNSENSRQRIKNLIKTNNIRWEKWREAARQEAKIDFKSLFKNPLFITGLMLYWGEGDSKSGNPVRLSNTDPRMIRLYIKFLTKSLNISKKSIKIALILYPDLSENECIKFWAKITGIEKSQFYKTQFIKGKHPTKKLSHGVCMVTCGNRQLKEKFIVWIDLLSKTL